MRLCDENCVFFFFSYPLLRPLLEHCHLTELISHRVCTYKLLCDWSELWACCSQFCAAEELLAEAVGKYSLRCNSENKHSLCHLCCFVLLLFVHVCYSGRGLPGLFAHIFSSSMNCPCEKKTSHNHISKNQCLVQYNQTFRLCGGLVMFLYCFIVTTVWLFFSVLPNLTLNQASVDSFTIWNASVFL